MKYIDLFILTRYAVGSKCSKCNFGDIKSDDHHKFDALFCDIDDVYSFGSGFNHF